MGVLVLCDAIPNGDVFFFVVDVFDGVIEASVV